MILKTSRMKNFLVNGLENIKKRDQIKDIYCQENNIKLFRISYKEFDYVENKLNEILNDNKI